MFLSNKVKSTKESVDDDKSKDIMDAESVNGELCTYLLTLITIIVYLLKSTHFKKTVARESRFFQNCGTV